jgi:molybdopterin molybdotransferase
MVCFALYVRPAIRRMHGHRLVHRRAIPVRTEERVTTGGRLTHLLRAVVREERGVHLARLTGPQGSGILTSMVRANALLIVPEDLSDVPAGTPLTAIPLEDGWGETDAPPV